MKPLHKTFVSMISISPILYLVGLAVSLLLHLAFPIPLFSRDVIDMTVIIGAIMIGLATLLVFWAQSISRQGHHLKQPTVGDFMRGPYQFMRHPGSLGLMMMFAGFVLVVNSMLMALLWVLFIVLETFFFIPTEESIYLEHHPDVYAEYKKRVRMWL